MYRSIRKSQEAEERAQAVLDRLLVIGPMSAKQLEIAVGCTTNQIYNTLGLLLGRGQITKRLGRPSNSGRLQSVFRLTARREEARV